MLWRKECVTFVFQTHMQASPPLSAMLLNSPSANKQHVLQTTDKELIAETHVYFTGHSLGGALATLATLDVSRNGIAGTAPARITVSVMYCIS